MEEAVAGTSTIAPESVINIDVDNLITNVDPIGAAFDPRTPPTTVEVPTSIICNQNRRPRDKSTKDMVNKMHLMKGLTAMTKWVHLTGFRLWCR
jgi:hypothetical protein